MAKPTDPLKILNTLAGAAHAKSQKPSKANPDPDHDGDNDMVPSLDTDKDIGKMGKKSSKQAAAIGAKEKGNAKAPKLPKPA